MSGHLIGCVKQLKLPSSHKLALIAFADSADDRTHIAFPGYEGVQEWADVSRSRSAELIKDLVAWNLLQPYKAARRGQRAEYIVFPSGCCDLHRPAEEPPGPDIEAAAAAAGVTVEQARALLGMVSTEAVVQSEHEPEYPQGNGSDSPDPSPRNGSDAPDPNGPVVHAKHTKPVENPGAEGPERVHRVQMGSDASDPFTPSTTSPLPPASGGNAATATNDARCSRGHVLGQGRNCRECGTTGKALAAARQRAAAEQRRAAHAAAAAADRNTPRGPTLPADIRAQMREAIRATQGATA